MNLDFQGRKIASMAFLSLFLLAACGQQASITPEALVPAKESSGNSSPTNDISSAQKTIEDGNIIYTQKLKLSLKSVSYTDSKGKTITKDEALKARGLNAQATNIPDNIPCEAKETLTASQFFLPRVYGRIIIDCYQPGGYFTGITYGFVRITDPQSTYADGYNTSFVTQHAEVLGGPVGKVTGRYVVQGTLDSSYAMPVGPTFTVYELSTQPLVAINAQY
jgi:hypothetical protein